MKAALAAGTTGRTLLLVLALFLAWAPRVRAQDDGPRVYMLGPVGAQSLTGFAVIKRGNEEPEVGTVIPGSRIDTDLAVLRYVGTFSLGGRQFTPFAMLPVGEVTSTVMQPGQTVSTSSSGLGDIQVGGVLGLIGSPALPAQQYAALKPGFSTGLYAKVYFPTGAYDAAKPVNFGSNRFAYQIGFPTTWAIGTSYRDPSLTTVEIFPTLTFYQPNDQPYGASRTTKDPLLSVEAHLTHNFNSAFWLSADLLYRQGGETSTDGVGDSNATRGLSGGASAAFTINPRAILILTYEAVIARNDDGPDGWFFRTALVVPF